MEPLNLMLVGCGMMGARHLRGYGELERVRPGSLKLRAVCDPQTDIAEAVASEAEELLGTRPATYPTALEALAAEPDIEAADVVTGNRLHDPIAIPVLEAGVHVLCEKPLGLTVARGQAIIKAAREAERVLAVAENNRRDPVNRLVKHLIGSGLIGDPHFVLQNQIMSGRRIIASVWRHAFSEGGLALDVGIHQAYMFEMLLGRIESVYAQSKQVWPTRLGPGPDGPDAEVPVESDDCFSAALSFENGVQGTWVLHFGCTGAGMFQRHVFGTLGTLEAPSGRSGGAPKARLEGKVVEGEALLERAPEFALNDTETELWGGPLGSYSEEGPVTDRRLIAAEVADFISAIRDGREPEVPGELGLRAVAIIYAVLESAALGEPVRVADVLSGEVREVQDRVEEAG